jgi:hypothetical protein
MVPATDRPTQPRHFTVICQVLCQVTNNVNCSSILACLLLTQGSKLELPERREKP